MPWSIGQLAALFVLLVLALLLFRFDPEPWIRDEAESLARSSGVEMTIGEVALAGSGIRLQGVTVAAPNLPGPVLLDRITLMPSLDALLAGSVKAGAEVVWQGVALTVDIGQSGNMLSLSNIDLHGGMSQLLQALGPYLKLPVAVTTAGEFNLSGNLEIDSLTGRPQSGAIKAVWNGAKAAAMGAELSLGNLAFDLTSDPKNPNQPWQWRLDDHGTGLITANGTMQKIEAPFLLWPIRGKMVIDPGKITDPTLLALLTGQQASKPIQLTFAGTLQSPVYSFSR